MARIAALCLAASVSAVAVALVNPAVQPRHLYELYDRVMACTVTQVDSKTLTVRLRVDEVIGRDFKPAVVVMRAEAKELLEAVLAMEKGQSIVAFAGRQSPAGKRNEVLYYVGGGKWYRAAMSADAPDQWELQADADEGKAATSEEIMFGVFNGQVESLWKIARDLKGGRQYFPAKPFSSFAARKIDTLPAPPGGVALFDIDGDGRLDAVVTSPGGDRLYIQNSRGEFEDRTTAMGLATRSRSVSLADADGDGKCDLLLDGVLYLRRGDKFEPSAAVPALRDVLAAAFVELSGDGRPDVVASVTKGGLRAFANGMHRDGKFADVTARMGLGDRDCGAGLTGYFEAGDWNSDGRTDLLYLAGNGYLLLADKEGFAPSPLREEGASGDLATAAMGYITEPGSPSAIIVHSEGKLLLESRRGGVVDVTRFGNEIQDDVAAASMVLADDLNADGTVDIYVATRQKGSPSFFATNRGYGSFMLEEKYAPGKVIPPEVYNAPAAALAAGDVDGDGANDLLIAGGDGTIWLLADRALEGRLAATRPSTPADERKRIEARSLTVRFGSAVGVVGARVRLLDAEGVCVAAGAIGSNIGVGCCGPQQVILTVREPGRHVLEVQFSDGAKSTANVDLQPDKPRHQVIKVTHPTRVGGEPSS